MSTFPKKTWTCKQDIPGSFVLLPMGLAFTGWRIDHVNVPDVFIAAGNLAALIS